MIKNRVAVIALAAGLVGGGAAGVALGLTTFAGAASDPSSSTTPSSSAPSSPNTPHSNENGTHEQSENPQREADENAGRVGGHCPGRDGNDSTTPSTAAPSTNPGT